MNRKKMKTINNYELFSEELTLTIESIDKDNIDFKHDSLLNMAALIERHEVDYPNIKTWFKDKVKPGIKNGERIAYVGYIDNLPIATAVLKLGELSKFCHLHIDKDYQNYNLGELFFTLMANNAKRHAKQIFFTFPESLWSEKRDFFQSFGFDNVSKYTKEYRNGDRELINRASFNTVWNNIINKLPKLNSRFIKYHDDIQNGIVMSIKPDYFDKIKSGEKTVEIRKYFNANLKGCKVVLYSSKPSQEIHGYVTIDAIEKNPPTLIWDKYKEKIACSEKEYFQYTKDTKEIYSIFFKNFNRYTAPIPLTQLNHLIGSELKPPQSYYWIKNNENWSNAISLSEILHKRYKITVSHA